MALQSAVGQRGHWRNLCHRTTLTNLIHSDTQIESNSADFIAKQGAELASTGLSGDTVRSVVIQVLAALLAESHSQVEKVGNQPSPFESLLPATGQLHTG